MLGRDTSVERLNGVADSYQELMARLRIERYDVPLNLAEESIRVRDAHEKGSRHEPRFEFESVTGDPITEMLSLRDEATAIDSLWRQPLVESLDYLVRTVQDAESHDPGRVTARTLKMFGPLDELLLVDALAELARPFVPSTEPPNVTAQEAVAVFDAALSRVGLKDWTALVEPHMSAMMDVSPERHEIRVRSGTRLTNTMLGRLLVHEIGCHVFRAASGARQPLRMLAFGLGGAYTATEEGLAGYLEQVSGIDDPADARRFALRYLAAARSLHAGFFETYAELRTHTDHDTAFETVARAKRGISDTSKAGSHVKDKAYFEGVASVGTLLRRRPEHLQTLYCGKITIEFLPQVEEGLRTGELYLPAYGPAQIADLLTALPSPGTGESFPAAEAIERLNRLGEDVSTNRSLDFDGGA